MDDRKDREDNIGSNEVIPSRTDNVRGQCKGGRKRRAGLVGSIVTKTISFTDIVGRSLVSSEMGLDPTNGVGPEEQPPKIAVDAIEKGGRGKPS